MASDGSEPLLSSLRQGGEEEPSPSQGDEEAPLLLVESEAGGNGRHRWARAGRWAAASVAALGLCAVALVVGLQLGAPAAARAGGLALTRVEVLRSSGCDSTWRLTAEAWSPLAACLEVSSMEVRRDTGNGTATVGRVLHPVDLSLPRHPKGKSKKGATLSVPDLEVGAAECTSVPGGGSSSPPLESFARDLAREESITVELVLRARAGPRLWNRKCLLAPSASELRFSGISLAGFGGISRDARIEALSLNATGPADCAAAGANGTVRTSGKIALSNPSSMVLTMPPTVATVKFDGEVAMTGTAPSTEMGAAAEVALSGVMGGPGATHLTKQFIQGTAGGLVPLDVTLAPAGEDYSAMDAALAKATALHLALPPQGRLQVTVPPDSLVVDEGTSEDVIRAHVTVDIVSGSTLAGGLCNLEVEVSNAETGIVLGAGVYEFLELPPKGGRASVAYHATFARTDNVTRAAVDAFTSAFFNGVNQSVTMRVTYPPAAAGVTLPPVVFPGVSESVLMGVQFDARAAVASVKELHVVLWVELRNKLLSGVELQSFHADVMRARSTGDTRVVSRASSSATFELPPLSITRHNITLGKVEDPRVLEDFLSPSGCGYGCAEMDLNNGDFNIVLGGVYKTRAAFGCDYVPFYCSVPMRLRLEDLQALADARGVELPPEALEQ